jgi:hypothetical protein
VRPPCSPELVQRLADGHLRGQCRCGWTSGDWARPTVAHLQQVEAAIDAHRPRMDPAVAAKLDELIETGNTEGVTPALVREVVSVFARHCYRTPE